VEKAMYTQPSAIVDSVVQNGSGKYSIFAAVSKAEKKWMKVRKL
jgi:hypothetical protein